MKNMIVINTQISILIHFTYMFVRSKQQQQKIRISEPNKQRV